MNTNRKVFVFGSNEGGIHGAGAARTALKSHGAVLGRGFGHYGNSFAIPTKDKNIQSLPIFAIENYVNVFISYARSSPKLEFQVTRIGCGLAGFMDEQIAPLFLHAPPENCFFDTKWKEFLGDQFKYWGTF